MSEQHHEREIDEYRDDQAIHNQTVPQLASSNPDTPAKRGRGRPKGSKNKKSVDAAGAGLASGSPSTSHPGEKRKRGRPPKVPYHLQFTDPSIIHDAIQSQEAADAASGKVPSKKPRGRPPKNPKPHPDEQHQQLQHQQQQLQQHQQHQHQQHQMTHGGPSGGVPLGFQGDEVTSMAKRMRMDGNE